MIRLRRRKYSTIAILIMLGMVFLSLPSYAACTNPAGQKADIIYNADHGVMQYCDDTDWVGMGRKYTTPASVDLTTGLIGHWKLDESSGITAADSSGNGNDGTLTNMDGATDWVPGKFNNALDFDGSGYVNIGNLSTSNTPLTISAWIKLDSYPTSGETVVISTDDHNTYYCGVSLKLETSGKPWIRNGTCTGNAGSHRYDTHSNSAPALNLAQWYHVAAVVRGAKDVDLYISGIKQQSKTGSGSANYIGFSSVPARIGRFSPYGPFYFKGQIDDVRIYNRELTATEVGTLAMAPPDLTSGLIGHWKLDESSGTTAADSSGNGKTATLINMDGATDWVSGKINNALDFDGVNDFVDAGNIIELGNTNITATVSFWAKGTGTMVSTERSSGSNGFSQITVQTDGSLKFYVANLTSSPWAQWIISSIKSDPSQWNYYAISIDGPNNQYTMSINNKTETISFDWSQNGTWGNFKNIEIGRTRNYNWGTAYTQAQIDDVRIYNRAISKTEIGQVFCAGAPGRMQYAQDSHVFQYCSNQGWAAMGPDKTGQVVNEPNLTSGLVMHWTMNETSGTTVSDASGNGNTGTLVNGPVWTSGKLNNAVDLDGTDDYINGPDNASLDFGVNDFSVSYWIKKQESTVSWDNSSGILKWNTGGSPGTNEWTLSIGGAATDGDDDQPNFAIESGTTRYPTTSPTPISLNQWHHLLGTRDGTNLKLYIDGQLKATTPVGTVAVNNVGRNIRIGTVIGHYTDAVYDDVRIYNRALTPAEISLLAHGAACASPTAPEGQMIYNDDYSLMQYCNGKDWVAINKPKISCPASLATGLTGHWKLDETSGTTASDSSGNGNNGTLTNMDGATDWVAGKLNNALDFDGVNDYIDLGNLQTLANSQRMSLAFWFYADVLPTAADDNDGLVMQQDNWDNQYGCRFDATSKVLACYVEKANISSGTGISYAGSTINTGTWYHVIFTFDSGASKLYLNEQLYSQDSTGPASIPDLSTNMRVGNARAATATSYLNGKIDDVRIYNRALTPVEISGLYNGGSGCP